MKLVPTIMALVLALVLSGCLQRRPASEATPSTSPVGDPDGSGDVAGGDESPGDCEARLERVIRELDEVEIRHLVAQTKLREIRRQDRKRETLLQDAVREVVRTKAKLQSLESKAEAASALAEVEVELGRLRDDYGGRETGELGQATRYLAMGSEEFEQGNFGGALYLTSQARSHLAAARAAIDEAGATAGFADEVVFDDVRFLRTIKNSNVRRGPGLEYGILVTLDRGTHVAGYSRLGDWLRVVYSDGPSGWIHQELLGTP